MDFTNHPLNNTTVTTGLNKLNPTVTVVREQVSFPGNKYYDVDKLYEQLSDLVNDKFKRWYCKQFYSLGIERTLELASLARSDGKDPKRLFSHLIKSKKQPKTTGFEWLEHSFTAFNGSGYADRTNPRTFVDSYIAYSKFRKRPQGAELAEKYYEILLTLAERLIENSAGASKVTSDKGLAKFAQFYPLH